MASDDCQRCTSTIGIARSGDGVAWKKHDDNPVLGPDLAPPEYVSLVSVARWKDEFRAVYVVEREFTSTAADEKEPPPRVMTARSEGGTIWQQAINLSGVSFDPPESGEQGPCIYADFELLHMWWIGSSEKKPAPHSVSRDGQTWSKPNLQPMREIDSREVSSVRFYPSGDFTIVVYVAKDHPNHASIATKVARGVRALGCAGSARVSDRAIGLASRPREDFKSDGARLFYSEPLHVEKFEIERK